MNEEEKVVSEKELEQEGEITLLEGNPFNGVCIDFYVNGQKSFEGHFKNGKEEGKKIYEVHFQDGNEL